jgi:hypothetical protein
MAILNRRLNLVSLGRSSVRKTHPVDVAKRHCQEAQEHKQMPFWPGSLLTRKCNEVHVHSQRGSLPCDLQSQTRMWTCHCQLLMPDKVHLAEGGENHLVFWLSSNRTVNFKTYMAREFHKLGHWQQNLKMISELRLLPALDNLDSPKRSLPSNSCP